jgi:hypothetical protein
LGGCHHSVAQKPKHTKHGKNLFQKINSHRCIMAHSAAYANNRVWGKHRRSLCPQLPQPGNRLDSWRTVAVSATCLTKQQNQNDHDENEADRASANPNSTGKNRRQ